MKNPRKFFHISLAAVIITVFVSIVSAQNMFRKVNDFDGDGKADFAVTRHSDAKYWWIWQTTAGVKVVPWGIFENDVPAAGDYDGDGKTDPAYWRGGSGDDSSSFYILESQTNTPRQQTFYNFIVSQPMHQDYNGDGKTDAGVVTGHSPLTLSVNYSGTGSNLNVFVYGYGLRLGDMDGDGRADYSYFNSNSGQLTVTMTNLVTNASRSVRFGLLSDQYQMADFDGDGTGDLTIWRPSDGTWWWMRSSDSVVNAARWGIDGDTPVPADYDGDGKTDLAIYRRGSDRSPQSHYWIYGSSSGVSVFAWGISTDSAVQY